MEKCYILITLLFFGVLSGFAQGYRMEGAVIDINNKPVESGNVILLSPKDSSIIKGDFFMDGKFVVGDIVDSIFILKITALGFENHFQVVANSKNDSVLMIEAIQLIMNATLKEVEVVSKLPLFERDGEKVKVNVENSALSNLGSVLDVLRKTPTVMVNSTDNVSVFGKGHAIIYVDGQQISSSDVLKTIASTELKEIEIISNPSAKYDASGRAVINIVTKKNNLEGYNGNLIQNILHGKYLFTYSGLRFNYKHKKWSTFVSYGFPHGKGWSSDEYYRNLKSNDSTITEMKNKIYTINNQVNSHYYRAGVSYAIDSTSSIGIQYNGFYALNKNEAENNNEILKNSIPQLTIETYTLSQPKLINNTANVNYTRTLDTLKSEWTTAFQYGHFTSRNFDEITQKTIFVGTTDQQLKRNNGLNEIQLFTGQTDLIKAFNKKWKLESGIKDSYIINESAIDFENYSIAGEWISDPAYFNGYKYSENVLAGYTQLRYSYKKLNMRAGLRAEHTTSNGFSKITNQQVINREYTNLFPSAFLGYDFTKDLNTSITYSSRIARPSFQDMDPFINYIDSLSSFRGNPYLVPAYTHSVEASLIYMKEASLTFSYSRTNGAMNLVVDKLDDGTDAFIATTKNLDYSETYSAGITIPYELSWWTTYNYFGYMENVFTYNSRGKVIQNRKPMFYMYLYDEFRFKKYFSMEITFEYTSAGVDGIFTFEPFYNLSANIKKTFFNDKLTCRFIANDILTTAFNRGSSNVEGYDVNYISRENTHFFLLSLNYRFGKLKSSNYKDKTVNQEEYDRIKMSK
ncbi:MAG: TonB-dependent receptor family protein [Bacteroidetes bacterium]|nr:TonB-dependent receptor family protein [Bacteroidota bacterium]